jgi:hypothetical protein
MKISDIVLEVRSMCDATSDSYSDATLLRRINQIYEEVVGKLIVQKGNWQFDDSNYTTFPIGVQTLVDNQRDYAFDTSHLVIERVEVKDAAGIWHLLNPIDASSLGMPLEEYQKDKGLPVEYDKSGSSLILLPAPSSTACTLTSGLRVYFQRTASIFTSAEVSTGTKVPGFASPYHMIICYGAALPYCMSYKKDRVALYLQEKNRLLLELLEFETNKDKDMWSGLQMADIDPR